MSEEKLSYSHTYRKIWIVVDIVVLLASIVWFDFSNEINSDFFTFWGFVVSVLAGVATIFEIMDSTAGSRTLSDEINIRTKSIEKTANELKNKNELISISECAVLLDQIIDLVHEEKFDEAIIYIREIRKNISKTELKILFNEKIEVDNSSHESFDFYEMERMVEAYRSAKRGSGRVPKYKVVRAKIYYAGLRTNVLNKT